MTTETKREEQSSEAWSRAAPGYAHTGPAFFQYFGNELVHFTQVPKGARVLDVATGRGAVLFPAAEKVGPQGEVIGVDYAAGMVKATNAEINSRGLKNASVRQMNAERLDFLDRTFEIVFCSFALFFFPYPNRALDEFHRVLKPGGKLAISTWGKEDPRWHWLSDLQKQFTPKQQSEAPRFNTPESLTAALQQAGFQNNAFTERTRDVFYTSADEWWKTQWTQGARQFLEQIPAETLAKGSAFAHQKLEEMQQPEGIPMLFHAWFALGYKP
jgi:ubiquinone/menaquinone biosynthesis C-methylase UbiE